MISFTVLLATNNFISIGDNQRNVGIIISGVVAALIVLAVAAAAAVTVLLIMPICELLFSPCLVCTENKLSYHNRYC